MAGPAGPRLSPSEAPAPAPSGPASLLHRRLPGPARPPLLDERADRPGPACSHTSAGNPRGAGDPQSGGVPPAPGPKRSHRRGRPLPRLPRDGSTCTLKPWLPSKPTFQAARASASSPWLPAHPALTCSADSGSGPLPGRRGPGSVRPREDARPHQLPAAPPWGLGPPALGARSALALFMWRDISMVYFRDTPPSPPCDYVFDILNFKGRCIIV